MGHKGKSAEDCRERFSTQKKRETCGEGPALPSGFWILLYEKMKLRPTAAICGHDMRKKGQRENDLEHCHNEKTELDSSGNTSIQNSYVR